MSKKIRLPVFACTLLIACLLSASSVFAAQPANQQIEKETAAGINEFAIDLYLELAKSEKGNIFFAPQNISAALAMAYAGASGENAKEMATVMHFGPNVHKGMGLLERRIESKNNSKSGPRVWTANAVWPLKNEDLKLVGAFEKIMKKDYRTEIRPLDYGNAPEGARQTINKWVEDKTKDRIKDLIPPGGISRITSMVLTSATYFLGDWEQPFPKFMTSEEWFYPDGKSGSEQKARIKLMFEEIKLPYDEIGQAQMIFMPYRGLEYGMVFILPKTGIRLSEYEKTLKQKKVRDQIQRVRTGQTGNILTRVYIPRFRTETKYALKKHFTNLGMRRAFDGGPFNKILTSKSTGVFLNMEIYEIYHKTFLGRH